MAPRDIEHDLPGGRVNQPRLHVAGRNGHPLDANEILQSQSASAISSASSVGRRPMCRKPTLHRAVSEGEQREPINGPRLG
jgi:hypothetical protein